jgi:hypothetical protein
LVGIQFLERYDSEWRVIDRPTGELVLMPRITGKGYFFGDAPPERVLDLIRRVGVNGVDRATLDHDGLRNAVTCGYALRIVELSRGTVRLLHQVKDAEAFLAVALRRSESFQVALAILAESPSLPATEIGRRLSERLKLPWSDASCLRRGGALRRWVRWYRDYA